MRIDVVNVSKKFKNHTVLENVNMELNPGKIYGFIGKNGSGKSVLLKIICGFYVPTSGEVLFDGKNVIKERDFAPSTRALIEKPSFLPHLSGYRNLKLLASIQDKIGDEKILDALKRVRLYDERNQKFSEYSLGTKQKLGIAQVLMEDVDILILDEPFNGIEKETTDALREELVRLKEMGKTIILATHIKEDIQTIVDVVYEFDARVVKEVSREGL